ncbi:UNVERIFIED_ORG: hypothetical protein ABIB52_000783 [Arthrobacter sp. UYCu721]
MARAESYRVIRKNRKEEVFDSLRREILAARLKVTLDEQLKRPTSPTVKRLADMKLPPEVRPQRFVSKARTTAGAA